MDELIKTVSEKAGINPDQAKAAVTSVLDFIKVKLPVVGDQVQNLIGGSNGQGVSLGATADALKKKFGF